MYHMDHTGVSNACSSAHYTVPRLRLCLQSWQSCQAAAGSSIPAFGVQVSPLATLSWWWHNWFVGDMAGCTDAGLPAQKTQLQKHTELC